MKLLISCCLIFLPLKHLQITSSFGARTHPLTGKPAFHKGVDLRAQHDTVYAVMNGVAKAVGYDRLLGIYITIDHGELSSTYGHLSQIFIITKDMIYAGEPIGITGATGRVTGEHLHFSVTWHNQSIDPMDFLYQNLINRNHE